MRRARPSTETVTFTFAGAAPGLHACTCSEASVLPQRASDRHVLTMRSCACEEAAQRLAARLGSSDAALQRYAAAAAAPAASDWEAGEGAKRQPRFAAGSPDNPIMLSEVKVGVFFSYIGCQVTGS